MFPAAPHEASKLPPNGPKMAQRWPQDGPAACSSRGRNKKGMPNSLPFKAPIWARNKKRALVLSRLFFCHATNSLEHLTSLFSHFFHTSSHTSFHISFHTCRRASFFHALKEQACAAVLATVTSKLERCASTIMGPLIGFVDTSSHAKHVRHTKTSAHSSRRMGLR